MAEIAHRNSVYYTEVTFGRGLPEMTSSVSSTHKVCTTIYQAYFLAVLKKLKPEKTQGFKKTQAFFPKN